MTISFVSFSQTKNPKQADANQHINWTNMSDALAKSEKTRKKILVDFYTDWCGWCKRMDKATYEDPRVIAMINKHFIAVKFNAESEGPIKYKGVDYALQAQGIRSTHALATKLLDGQMGYPTTTFLNLDHSRIQNIPGYIEAGEMISILKYFGENKHLTLNYEEFKKQELSKAK
jgi:thioredoxin-related protein